MYGGNKERTETGAKNFDAKKIIESTTRPNEWILFIEKSPFSKGLKKKIKAEVYKMAKESEILMEDCTVTESTRDVGDSACAVVESRTLDERLLFIDNSAFPFRQFREQMEEEIKSYFEQRGVNLDSKNEIKETLEPKIWLGLLPGDERLEKILTNIANNVTTEETEKLGYSGKEITLKIPSYISRKGDEIPEFEFKYFISDDEVDDMTFETNKELIKASLMNEEMGLLLDKLRAYLYAHGHVIDEGVDYVTQSMASYIPVEGTKRPRRKAGTYLKAIKDSGLHNNSFWTKDSEDGEFVRLYCGGGTLRGIEEFFYIPYKIWTKPGYEKYLPKKSKLFFPL